MGSQYNLACHKANFILVANYVDSSFREFIEINNLREKDFAFLSGLLNIVWHEWIQFWRSYWLGIFIGGLDLKGNQLLKISLSDNEQTILYYIKHILHDANTNNRSNGSLFYYNELTWGDIDKISTITRNLSNLNQARIIQCPTFFNLTTISPINIEQQLNKHATIISSVLSTFSIPVKHLQTTRNASIHLQKELFADMINHIIPRYSLARSYINHPVELLFAIEPSSGKIAILSWIESMITILNILESNS